MLQACLQISNCLLLNAEDMQMLKLVMLYRILYHFVKMESPGLTHFTTRTRGHSLCLTQPFARTDIYFHSFYPSSIRLWNNLPCDIVECSSIEQFKDKLSNLYIDN